MSIDRVFVAGAGLMGHGIAQVVATTGRPVTLYEPDLERAVAGRVRILGNLERAVSKGRMTQSDRDRTIARIEATDDIGLVGDADLVVEAVFEDVSVKSSLWRSLDERAADHAVFATNTSSISIDRLAEAVAATRRERFLGMHFFSPVPAMPLVEIIRGSDTSDETADAIRTLAGQLGKEVIVSSDRPGFIVNRVLMPFLAESMRTYEEGTGTAEDIDTGAKTGLNHPMGPLELADFIGLDVCLNIMRVLHEGLGGEHFRPPRILEELVAAGHLGQKTGRGFYSYGPSETISAEIDESLSE
jgi:3-hydroxybutyryl-CoA dehydrogenase